MRRRRSFEKVRFGETYCACVGGGVWKNKHVGRRGLHKMESDEERPDLEESEMEEESEEDDEVRG